MVKEIKTSERSSEKRSASGQLVANDVVDLDEHCTEYALKLLSKAIKAQSLIIDENCPYIWRMENGIEVYIWKIPDAPVLLNRTLDRRSW
jgi:hypothetical protein